MVTHEIALLSKETIDQIAAGEVVERPASVVKELVENAMDAGANAITVEIKDGGKSFLRVTDNGCGIKKEQLQIAFMRHATSKIKDATELATVQTLGFRGEALSSISAVSHVEMITKTEDSFIGSRYVIEGSDEVSLEEVGAPNGTTIMVYQLFYNTPARKKFLKSDQTEGSYIGELMERLALSHPQISFSFISNKKEKLHTSGNGNLKDAIYQIYGKEITNNLLEISHASNLLDITGYIGNSSVARGNRSLETFFIDGRYIKSPLLSRAVEEGYQGYLMQHQYPFCVLQVTTKDAAVDVNVHPTKQEVRFEEGLEISNLFTELVYNKLHFREDIQRVEIPKPKINQPESKIEQPAFSPLKMDECKEEDSIADLSEPKAHVEPFQVTKLQEVEKQIEDSIHQEIEVESLIYEQTTFLSEDQKAKHRIIGQVFDTYWLIEHNKELFIIDQHAAHEKVLFEKTMKALDAKEMTSQMISPPIILTLTAAEQQVLSEYEDVFIELGFSFSSFGGNEFALNAVPGNLFSIDYKQMFLEILDDCCNTAKSNNHELILEKVASMSCKAAVKGNNRLSYKEVETLLDDLLALENPYHCPHGRPTIISMTKQELEKKFKRIVS